MNLTFFFTDQSLKQNTSGGGATDSFILLSKARSRCGNTCSSHQDLPVKSVKMVDFYISIITHEILD